jgi:hypothetical protein
MSHAADESALASRRHITLILRLTLDQGERLVQGELVDTTDTLHQRFTGVVGLKQAVEGWLTKHVHTEEAPKERPPA